jgi:LemA protein
MIYIILGIIAISLLFLITSYNNLIKNKNLVAEGWSSIDVQLKKRSNLIPNILSSVKGYMSHEKKLLEEITELRSQSIDANNVIDQGKAESSLSGSLMNLFAVAENYPELKANENFLDLQKQLQEIEDDIQMARRYYNGTVRNNNVLVESFPTNLVANAFSFEKADFFEIEDQKVRDVPKVKF